MPYEDKQVLRGSDGLMYQYDAAKNDWSPHTSTPSGKDKEVVKADPKASTAGIVGATAKDMERGTYHGLASNFVPGILGLPGQAGNAAYNWWTGTEKSPFAGPSDIKDYVRKGEKAVLGQEVPRPVSRAGEIAETAATYAPMMLMPAAGATAGAGAGIVRSLPSVLGRRFMGNVAAPTVASEAADYVTGGNEAAKFAAALLAGRGANPFGGGRNLATQEAMSHIGARGASAFDRAGNKTVIPNRLRELGTQYDDLERRYGLQRGELREANRIGMLSPADSRQYLNTDRQFAVGSDLNELAQKQSAGQFTPKQIRDTIVDTTSDAHNTASKLAKRSFENMAPVAGAGLGALASHAASSTFGIPGGHYTTAAGGMAGYGAGKALAHYGVPLLNAKTLEALLGNSPGRSAMAWDTYSAPMRSRKDDE